MTFDLPRRVRTWAKQRSSDNPRTRASFYYACSSIICQGIRFIGVLLSTRLILPEQFGLFAQASLALCFAGLIKEIGQANGLYSYQGNDRRFILYGFQINLLGGLLAAALLLGVPAGIHALPWAMRRAAPIMAAIALVESLFQTPLIVSQKNYRFLLLGCVDIAAVSAWSLALVLCVGHMDGFLALLFAQLAESSMRGSILMAVVGRHYIGWASGADLRAYYFGKFARTMIPHTFVQTLATRMDFLLLSTLSTPWELGVYERTLQFVRIPWSLSINLMDRVLVVSYSKEQADPAALRATLQESQRKIGAAVLGAVALVSVFIVFLLRFAIGAQWPPIIRERWWVALPFTILIPFIWNLNYLFQGTGHPAQLLKNVSVPLVLEFAIGIMLVGRYGASGMLATRGLAHAVLLGYQMLMVKRFFRASPESPPQPG